MEGTSQELNNIKLCVIVKIFVKSENRVEYGAVWLGKIYNVKPFQINNEMDKICFWHLKCDIGYIDGIDRKLIDILL